MLPLAFGCGTLILEVAATIGSERGLPGKMEKHKILWVTSIPITFEKILLTQIMTLKENGFLVDLCCGEGEYLEDLRKRGFKVMTVPFSRASVSINHMIAFLSLYRFLKKEKYMIAHFHTPVAAAIGRVAARLAGVPIVMYTAHGFYFHEGMNKIVYKAFFWAEKTLARIATDWILLVSKEDKEIAERHNFLRERRRIVWIGNGVSPGGFIKSYDRAGWREQHGFSEDDYLIGFVGRVVEEKGILELIEAFAQIKIKYLNAKLLIVGGTLQSERDQGAAKKASGLIERFHLQDDVTFLGLRNDVPAILAAIDLFVLPSYREGLPVSIIEAMMCGKPVIATNIRGCREEVVHGETGLLVRPKDVGDLARAIEALASDPELARAMGEKGRARALLFYDEKFVLERLIDAYKMAVEGI